jgi:predicted transcriptional regulator
MYQILSAEKEPVTRTRLIYASFLSNSELRQYIALLLEHEMLEADPITKTKLKVTKKGKKFLKLYESILNIKRSTPHNNLSNVDIMRSNVVAYQNLRFFSLLFYTLFLI